MTELPPLAFVDLETTGSTAGRDRITEIGIVEVVDGLPRRWSQLLNPGIRIPGFIQSLTGITDDMVQDQPRFEDVAGEILDRLRGKLFVAHNARFDYGFLRSEFKACGIDWFSPVLCTVKLSRKLFPKQGRHNLDALVSAHQLTVTDRHRALGDADLLHQFWRVLQGHFDAQTLISTIAELMGQSVLPPNLDVEQVDRLPDGPGVYIFKDAQQQPLYIGKSKNLRARVLAHFSAALSKPKEMSMSQQVVDIEWIETAGETGALLMEARLIKDRLPRFNVKLRRQRDLFAWQAELPAVASEPMIPQLVTAPDLALGAQEGLYGPFRSRRDAMAVLEKLAKEQQLCRAVLGIEKAGHGKPCFAFQIRQCAGACVGEQPMQLHNLKLLTALARHKIKRWPFQGIVGLREGQEVHILHEWRHLGTAKSEDEVEALIRSGRPVFDMDTYKILNRALAKARPEQLFEMPVRPVSSSRLQQD